MPWTEPASLELLRLSARGLADAAVATTAAERYAAAHLAALRAAAAVLAARARPAGARRRPASVWVLLPAVAPELAEWSAFFAAGATKRAAAEAGLRVGHRPRGRRPRSATRPRSSRWSRRRSGWCTSRPSSQPYPADQPDERSLRPPARRVRLLPAPRRLPSPGAGRPGRRARHGHPRPHRPRRRPRRGQVRQGRPRARRAPDPRRRPRGRCRGSSAGQRPTRRSATRRRSPDPWRGHGRPAPPAGRRPRPGRPADPDPGRRRVGRGQPAGLARPTCAASAAARSPAST